jgi:hypothetical protein
MDNNEGKEIISDTKPINKETLPEVPKNRILIFGSTQSGIFEMQKDFKEYLKERGILDPHVETARYIDSIKPAIFGTHAIPESEEEKRKNLPKGVIVLPTMRQETEAGNMTIDTYNATSLYGQTVYDYIKTICGEYNVPVIFLGEDYSREKMEKEINKLLKFKKIVG